VSSCLAPPHSPPATRYLGTLEHTPSTPIERTSTHRPPSPTSVCKLQSPCPHSHPAPLTVVNQGKCPTRVAAALARAP
jgi:hypothetical protein